MQVDRNSPTCVTFLYWLCVYGSCVSFLYGFLVKSQKKQYRLLSDRDVGVLHCNFHKEYILCVHIQNCLAEKHLSNLLVAYTCATFFCLTSGTLFSGMISNFRKITTTLYEIDNFSTVKKIPTLYTDNPYLFRN